MAWAANGLSNTEYRNLAEEARAVAVCGDEVSIHFHCTACTRTNTFLANAKINCAYCHSGCAYLVISPKSSAALKMVGVSPAAWSAGDHSHCNELIDRRRGIRPGDPGAASCDIGGATSVEKPAVLKVSDAPQYYHPDEFSSVDHDYNLLACQMCSFCIEEDNPESISIKSRHRMREHVACKHFAHLVNPAFEGGSFSDTMASLRRNDTEYCVPPMLEPVTAGSSPEPNAESISQLEMERSALVKAAWASSWDAPKYSGTCVRRRGETEFVRGFANFDESGARNWALQYNSAGNRAIFTGMERDEQVMAVKYVGVTAKCCFLQYGCRCGALPRMPGSVFDAYVPMFHQWLFWA